MDTIGERAGRSLMQGTTIREVIEFERRDARNAALEEAVAACRKECAEWQPEDRVHALLCIAVIRALKT